MEASEECFSIMRGGLATLHYCKGSYVQKEIVFYKVCLMLPNLSLVQAITFHNSYTTTTLFLSLILQNYLSQVECSAYSPHTQPHHNGAPQDPNHEVQALNSYPSRQSEAQVELITATALQKNAFNLKRTSSNVRFYHSYENRHKCMAMPP